MDSLFSDILSNFWLDSPPVSCEIFGCGHVNKTYLVVTETGHRYTLQKIGPAFKDVHALQDNIAAVIKHLHEKTPEKHGALTLIPTTEGEDHYHAPDGHTWRMYEFIEDGICLEAAQSPMDFYQAAIAFGTFQQQLKDFPAHTLYETIPEFHNTIDRYRIFHEALEKDVMGRAKDVQAEIEFALAREKEAATLVELLEAGKLPLRVTHNDTKINNVLFHPETKASMIVVDLDTVMPGLMGHDFGDAIRFAANFVEEDCRDYEKVGVDLEVFRAFAEGFLSKTAKTVTPKELDTLALSCFVLTAELATRFLADYLDGDLYFKTNAPDHNLVRTRCQIALAKDMLKKMDRMEAIVRECAVFVK